MKPGDCIPEDEFGAARGWAADDPRRAHLDACPRCRALLLNYETFVAPAPAAASVYGDAERRALDAAREKLLGVPAAPEDAAAGPVRRAATPEASAPWWASLFAPRLRPAWAFAAIAIVATLVVLLPRGADREAGDGGEVLRGATGGPLAPAEPVLETSGAIRFAWSPAPDADGYEIRFYSAALDPIGVVDAGDATGLALDPARLPEAYARGEMVLFRVAAFHDGDEVALSEARALPAR